MVSSFGKMVSLLKQRAWRQPLLLIEAADSPNVDESRRGNYQDQPVLRSSPAIPMQSETRRPRPQNNMIVFRGLASEVTGNACDNACTIAVMVFSKLWHDQRADRPAIGNPCSFQDDFAEMKSGFVRCNESANGIRPPRVEAEI